MTRRADKNFVVNHRAASRIVDAPPSRKDYLVAVVITLAVMLTVAALFYWRLKNPTLRSNNEPRLEGAVRTGEAEFENLRNSLVVEDLVATKAFEASGETVMELTGSVRNTTERGISGLEIRGMLVGGEGQRLRERTVIVTPAEKRKLQPGEKLNVRVVIEGIDPEAENSAVRLEIAGVRFE